MQNLLQISFKQGSTLIRPWVASNRLDIVLLDQAINFAKSITKSIFNQHLHCTF